MSFRNLIRTEIQELPGRQPEPLQIKARLHLNESPLEIPLDFQERLQQKLAAANTTCYPDPDATAVRSLFAIKNGLHPDQIMVGNSCDDLIQSLMRLFWSPGAKLVLPVPAVQTYSTMAKIAGYEVVEAYLDETFDLPIEEMVSVTRREGVKMILLSSPNNPTGNVFSEERIIELLERTDAAIVVDLSYAPFSRQDLLPLLRRYENLVLVRSLAPLGLAGVPIGIMSAAKDVVYEANKTRPTYWVNVLSQEAAAVFIESEEQLRDQISCVVAGRNWLAGELAATRGITVYPSEANFLMFKVAAAGEALSRRLVEEGILISNLSRPGRLFNCFRVTIGADEVNSFFIETLKKRLTC